MFMEPSSLPQNNEGEEASLRQELLALENTTPSASRGRCLELENKHAARREWVWAKLDQAPLAKALEHLAVLATRTASRLGGASVAEMSRLYIDSAWEIDAAALASMAAVKLSADAKAVSRALNVFYRPWLESAADHLQELARKEPLPDSGGQSLGDLLVEPGGVILFADGLRFDVSQNLAGANEGKKLVSDHVDSLGRPADSYGNCKASSFTSHPRDQRIGSWGRFSSRHCGYGTATDHGPFPKAAGWRRATSISIRMKPGILLLVPGPRTASSTSWAIQCRVSWLAELRSRWTCW